MESENIFNLWVWQCSITCLQIWWLAFKEVTKYFFSRFFIFLDLWFLRRTFHSINFGDLKAFHKAKTLKDIQPTFHKTLKDFPPTLHEQKVKWFTTNILKKIYDLRTHASQTNKSVDIQPNLYKYESLRIDKACFIKKNCY